MFEVLLCLRSEPIRWPCYIWFIWGAECLPTVIWEVLCHPEQDKVTLCFCTPSRRKKGQGTNAIATHILVLWSSDTSLLEWFLTLAAIRITWACSKLMHYHLNKSLIGLGGAWFSIKCPQSLQRAFQAEHTAFLSAEHGPLLGAAVFKDSLTARLSHVVSVDAYSFVRFL